MFCKHRWTNIKTWLERKTLNVIQRCRWCNQWKRLTLDQEGVDVDVKTVRYKQDGDAHGESDSSSDAIRSRQSNVVDDNSQQIDVNDSSETA